MNMLRLDGRRRTRDVLSGSWHRGTHRLQR
jgi:hypothetical protein